MSFQAFRIHKTLQGVEGRFEQLNLSDLTDGDVVIRNYYSSVNFKDALAGTGAGHILKRFPLVGGIDACGIVESSSVVDFKPGQWVVVTGCNHSETFDGGYAEYVRANASAVVPLPKELSPLDAMTLGTAGFTAALCFFRMLMNGQKPEMGPIVVTGATGGVGAISITLAKRLSFQVIAVSGKPGQTAWLQSLGADEVISPENLNLGSKPLEKARFGGAIDNVGGELLSGIIRHTDLYGNIASVGLAGGSELQSTVMPHILRGVSLLGISSNNCPRSWRTTIWEKLARDWKPKQLDSLRTQIIGLSGLPSAFRNMLDRKTFGRIVVSLEKA